MWLGYIQQRSPPHSKPFSNNHLVPPLSKYIELEFDWLEPYFSRGKNQFYGILGFVDGCMQVTRLSHTVPSTKTLFWIRQLSSSLLNCWNDIFLKTCCNGNSHGFQYAKKRKPWIAYIFHLLLSIWVDFPYSLPISILLGLALPHWLHNIFSTNPIKLKVALQIHKKDSKYCYIAL